MKGNNHSQESYHVELQDARCSRLDVDGFGIQRVCAVRGLLNISGSGSLHPGLGDTCRQASWAQCGNFPPCDEQCTCRNGRSLLTWSWPWKRLRQQPHKEMTCEAWMAGLGDRPPWRRRRTLSQRSPDHIVRYPTVPSFCRLISVFAKSSPLNRRDSPRVSASA